MVRIEELVRQGFLNHLDVVGECVHELKKILQAYLAGDEQEFLRRWEKLDKLESKADGIRREVELNLYKGAFMPVYRGDFFELVEMIDKIANQAEYVSNMLKLTRMEIPAKYKEGLIELIDGAIKTFDALKKTVILLHENIEKVVSAITEVRDGEKKVDDISEQLVENVFKDGRPSAMDLIRAHMLSALIREISEIADLAEDTSDHLMKHVGKMII
jgi:hypothetical protein